MKEKPKVILKGDFKNGFVITIEGRDGFKGDIALTSEEIILLKKILDKRI